MFESIVALMRKYNDIVVYRHSRPDGDAVGSQSGLSQIIKANWPDKNVICVGDSAGRYSFINGSATSCVDQDMLKRSLAVILDCGGENMVSEDSWKNAAESARIDHHLFSGQFAETEVIDSSFESCCGMIAFLAFENRLEVPQSAAKAIYTGMVTDSGRFRYDNVNSRTLALASKLLETGFETDDIYMNLYADTLENLKRRSAFISKIQTSANNVAYVYTDRKQAEEMGMDAFSICRGLVNTMADLQGVHIWVNFTEDGGPEKVLCEIRASDCNINPIAVKYGGGGHAKASGATVDSKEKAMAMLADLDEMSKEINNGNK